MLSLSLLKFYLKHAIDGICYLLGKRRVHNVDVFSESCENTTGRSRVEEGQRGPQHAAQHHQVHLTSGQPTAQLRRQIGEKTPTRYNIRRQSVFAFSSLANPVYVLTIHFFCLFV